MQDEIRAAASRWLEEQTAVHGDALPRRLLEEGFAFRGSRVTLVGPSGIWKPRGFETVPPIWPVFIHAAFDNNILGITPDYEIELRRDILEEIDGPMLRYGMQDDHL